MTENRAAAGRKRAPAGLSADRRPDLGDRIRAVRAVVFDVGETLVDETRAWSIWADHLGVPRLTFFSALGASILEGGHHHDPMRLFRPGIDVDAESAALRAAGLSWHASAEDLYPDALRCLRALTDLGYRLGVAANQPAEVAEVFRTLGVDFQLVGMSAAWGLHKPDPAFFARVADELRLPPEAIAYVGDRVDNDVRPAAAAGMLAVFVRRGPWGWIQAGHDDPPEADIVVGSLAELAKRLGPAGGGPE
jgi:FMN phosphatase YigB (HAD superfamily)